MPALCTDPPPTTPSGLGVRRKRSGTSRGQSRLLALGEHRHTHPKDLPQQHSQGGQHQEQGLLGGVTFSTLKLLCSVLAATLGAQVSSLPHKQQHFW